MKNTTNKVNNTTSTTKYKSYADCVKSQGRISPIKIKITGHSNNKKYNIIQNEPKNKIRPVKIKISCSGGNKTYKIPRNEPGIKGTYSKNSTKKELVKDPIKPFSA